MSNVPVHPFTPRGFWRKCGGDGVSRSHHAALDVLIVDCPSCGHVSASEPADVPRSKVSTSVRSIELPARSIEDDEDEDATDEGDAAEVAVADPASPPLRPSRPDPYTRGR